MNARTCTFLLAIPALLAPTSARAQPPAAPPPASARPGAPEDVTLVAQGWLLLSQGSAVQAAARAREALQRSPASPGAVALAVEAEIARGGSTAGLAEYEHWLGARSHEEPLLLRRVSHAVLREAAAQQSDPGARLGALRALAGDGDAAAVGALTTAMAAGSTAAARALAETGNPDAVRYLVDGIKSGAVEPVAALESLGKSQNPQSTSAALARLADPRPEIRGAAADALGRLRAGDAVTRLRALLNDGSSYVRVRAASALLAIGDEAGLPVIRELASSESAQARLIAANALAERRDAEWVDMVRKLTAASEPEVRLGAARLIAGSDPELARSVIDGLREDANPAIRTLASDAALGSAGPDLVRLRALLHSPTPAERVRAAEGILASTR